ncbi:hypothetical protein NLU13_9515 [Sarocladium strictum]|uniref:Dnase1 protein n=1 Tax=Sarocladium strictum TaxID=5046 RepID=A0AA39GBN7_SARSR|nr:hypothetical protein NLU13_9515 [Sarocladium strictum]
MHFATSFFGLAAAAIAVNAASVTFKTLDDVTRKIVFTPSPGSPQIEPVTVNNAQDTTVQFPDHYQGNFYAVAEGANDQPGMLGELLFGGWMGFTYFDVSAIVDPNDKNGVKLMYPAEAQQPTSGCESFPCNNAYYLPDDVQTKVTPETHIITTLGGSA